MGCWGMGITQSDEYCEVYERYIEEYDEGKPTADIKKDILDGYLSEFDADDGVLHDVYFALAKAEWMCGGVSDEIMQKVRCIIENGENIAFLAELDATEEQLKERKRNLDKFLKTLSVPRVRARKRRISEERYLKSEKDDDKRDVFPESAPLPPLKVGDVFAFPIGERYRVFAVARKEEILRPVVYCYVWAGDYDTIPTLDRLENEYVMPIGYLLGKSFPNMSRLEYVGNSESIRLIGRFDYPAMLYSRWKDFTWAMPSREELFKAQPIEYCLKLSDLAERIRKRSAKNKGE